MMPDVVVTVSDILSGALCAVGALIVGGLWAFVLVSEWLRGRRAQPTVEEVATSSEADQIHAEYEALSADRRLYGWVLSNGSGAPPDVEDRSTSAVFNKRTILSNLAGML